MKTEELSLQIAAESHRMSSVRDQLAASFKVGEEYRHAFVEEKIRTGLAAQIRAMREARPGLTQKKLGQTLGKAQSWIARLEDPNEVPPTLPTLLQVAQAFDVDLQVRFAPFSELIDWMSGTPRVNLGLSADALSVSSFKAEEEAGVFDSVPNTIFVASSHRNKNLSQPITEEVVAIGRHATFRGVQGGSNTFPVRKGLQSQTQDSILGTGTGEVTAI